MIDQTEVRALVTATAEAVNGLFAVTEQPMGRFSAWLTLSQAGDVMIVARACKQMGARLSMITALADRGGDGNIVAYHFDIQGSSLTVKALVAKGGSLPSLVPVFRNADWHEREFMEFYDIAVEGRAGAPRLFLDETVKAHAMERLIPLSVLANAASTQTLWERLTLKEEE